MGEAWPQNREEIVVERHVSRPDTRPPGPAPNRPSNTMNRPHPSGILRAAARALLLLAPPTQGVYADVSVPAIFSDHMVLQGGIPTPIWGRAEPGEKVTVAINGQIGTSVADERGRWKVILKPLQPGNPTIVTISGKTTIVIQDVLIGEVWFCSGQSNMAGVLNNRPDLPEASPSIRSFLDTSKGSGQPQEESTGQWISWSPANAKLFSGTAFHFGKHLHDKLQQPVGLITSAVGGTQIETWIPAAPMKVQSGPGSCYNGKVAPHVGFGIKGFVWYQGESNARTPEQGRLYARKLTQLVSTWRELWGVGDLPFAWVQLPKFDKPEFGGWREVRESMLHCLSIPNTGMAVTIDSGDPSNIHPANKPLVGERLALWALAKVYGYPNTPSGPLPAGHKIQGSEIICHFLHGEGLKAKGGELKGFSIAGEDRVWFPASANIEDGQVRVSSLQVKNPVAVRYGWENAPDANLVNGADLPASPFRSDAW